MNTSKQMEQWTCSSANMFVGEAIPEEIGNFLIYTYIPRAYNYTYPMCSYCIDCFRVVLFQIVVVVVVTCTPNTVVNVFNF